MKPPKQAHAPWILGSRVLPCAWVTTEQLIADTRLLAESLPADIGCVIGMARSGLIAATYLACQLHVPLACVTETGHITIGGGCRARNMRWLAGRPLVLDDTLCSGRTMLAVQGILRAAYPETEILQAVIYSARLDIPCLTYVVRHYPTTHYLEWNYFNSSLVRDAAFDFDGILCHDISAEDDDDGPRYLHAIRHARALAFPRRNVLPAIITARMNRYRRDTVEWMQRYGIKTRTLRMGPWKSLKERNQPDEVVAWKAAQFASLSAKLFVESDWRQAGPIAKLAGKPVLCPAAKMIFLASSPQTCHMGCLHQ